jgi:ligand-binding sensor domain-containing protein
LIIARSFDVIRRGTTIGALSLLLEAAPALALDPSLEVSQYGHAAWTARNGFSVGAIFAMAQTPDGYLWLGSEFGLFRFDGVQAVPWQPPAGQKLPDKPYALLVTRDGTLWIGTFRGLVSWKGDKLTRYPEIGDRFVTSLLEDREGTVWVGLMGQASDAPTGELCAIRSGHAQCDLRGGAFGEFVWSLFETAQELSGPALNLESGDGNPALPGAMRRRGCGSAISLGPTTEMC